MTAKILVLNDEPSFEQLINQQFKRRIQSRSLSFIFCSSRVLAIQQLRSDPAIALVLTDISRPTVEGLSLLEALPDIAPTIQAVAIAADGDTKGVRAALHRGAVDFLTKPIDIQDLEATVDQMLDRTLNQALNQTLKAVEPKAQIAQLQQALAYEIDLRHITDQVRGSLDESQIFQTVVRELGQTLGVLYGAIRVYTTEQTPTALICYEYAPALAAASDQVFQMTGSPSIRTELIQGRSCQFCLICSPPHPLGQPSTTFACPIADEQGLVGELWLFKPHTENFDDQETQIVRQVAHHCTISVRLARLYLAVQMQVEGLEAIGLLKDDFLSTVSHELRSPITNMKMAIQMLKTVLPSSEISEPKDPGREPSELYFSPLALRRVHQYLQILEWECEQEINLINDLLDLQRVDAGVQPLVQESICLEALLLPLIESFQERTYSRQQQLQLVLEDSLPELVSDAIHLRRILTELLHNACKYTPPGERITVTVRTQQNLLEMRVSNSGIEISAEEIPRIFDKFYRIPRSDRWHQGGTGLGLALVKKLIAHLGGTIAVESHSGQTCFALAFPISGESFSGERCP